MALDIKKFIVRFIEEARDHINRLNEGLATLDAGSADAEVVNTIFRSAHTVKGSSRMLKLVGITDTAHQMEEVLMHLRDGKLVYGPALGQLLYQGVDALSNLVDALAKTNDPGSLPAADSALCDALAKAALGQAKGAEPTPVAVADTAPPAAPVANAEEPTLKIVDTVRIRLSKLDELVKLMGEVVSSHASMRQRLLDIGTLTRAQGGETLTQALQTFASTFRDDVLTQEALMVELHDTTLRMRMLPLAIVFEPAARLVRELARSVGKEVECVISGAEIELDRQMIDKLSDPIIHLIRNGIDHGLELPEQRLAHGKPAQGRLKLSARQDGGWVVIDVTDDGGGIPVAAVRDKAVKKGLVTLSNVAALSDQEIIDFIFMPGFSTSSIITDLSGRGVGMDVVKRCVLDDLRGVVSVETRPGQGTTFSLRLPLSLAVMRVLLVEVDGLPFAFTAQYVGELLRRTQTELLTVAERKVIILRNEFVPVVPLNELLQTTRTSGTTEKASSSMLLLVLQVRGEKLAVVIDELLDERDMVIKPLPPQLRKLALVSGMVTTGKNELVNVLHAPALFDIARRARASVAQDGAGVHSTERVYRVLVVDDSLNTREIERDVLEASGYDVTLAEDGLDGLKKALDQDFDAILTDVEMPNMDGFTLTARLRQEERYRDKPIIIITSRAKDDDKRRGVQAGADAYIVKGDFDRSNLIDTLRTLLG